MENIMLNEKQKSIKLIGETFVSKTDLFVSTVFFWICQCFSLEYWIL